MTEFTWPVRVYYEDTDAGGVVYYANYLKFLERARTEMLRELGFELDRLAREKHILFIVRKVTIDYHKPAFMDDMLVTSARIEKLRKASIVFQQSIENLEQETLCRAEVIIACIDNITMKPVAIPEPVISELAHVD